MKNKKAFSLIELMVVVAIISIILLMGFTNFTVWARKSKQSEARLGLTDYYARAKMAIGNYADNPGNFRALGFQPEGQLVYRILAADSGFDTYAGRVGIDDACVSTAACAGDATYSITWTEGPSVCAPGSVAPMTAGGTFRAVACANLGGNQTDEWAIDEAKNLCNGNGGTCAGVGGQSGIY